MASHRVLKRDSYKWMTPVCTLKFDASHFPFECVPFWDKWRNVLAPEPDCANCQVAREYHLMIENNGKVVNNKK